MESSAESKQPSASSKKIIIIAAAVLLIAILAVGAAVLHALNEKEDNNGLGISYASEARVMLDQDSLQAAVDEAQRNAREGKVALMYQNDAYSKDGKTFSCYIANSSGNMYDMFLTIFADAEMTDQIFLSGLVAPGNGFEEITLDHALEVGDHTVYVAVTQVDTGESGEQVIKNQVVHTIKFHVEAE